MSYLMISPAVAIAGPSFVIPRSATPFGVRSPASHSPSLSASVPSLAVSTNPATEQSSQVSPSISPQMKLLESSGSDPSRTPSLSSSGSPASHSPSTSVSNPSLATSLSGNGPNPSTPMAQSSHASPSVS